MKTKIIVTCVAALLIAAVAVKLKNNKAEVEKNVYRLDPDKKVLVQARTVLSQRLDKTYTYTGTFAPNKEVLLIPQAHGQVHGIYFDEGDIVHQGSLLVQIDDELLQAQHISAEATYQTARRNFERYEKASESDGVSKMQFDDYRLKFRNAESQLKQLEKQIRLTRLTAPFTGTITMRDAELGSVVGGNPVGRLTDLSRLKLEISVPENEIVMFHEGDAATVRTDLQPDVTHEGKVEYVSDRADDSHNYTVRIIIRNNAATDLRAGMYGTVSLNKGLSESTLIVPRTALIGSAKNPQVFVVEDGTVTLKSIQTGKSTGEAIEVTSGIRAGEVVVTGGHINLTEGSKVEIKSNEGLAALE